MKKTLEWLLPIETVSEANLQQHWSKKHKRHKAQKIQIWCKFQKEKPSISLPCIVHLTRISPRFLDDDNLRVAFKWIRDEIANNIIPGKAAGRADDDPRIEWQYSQEKGEKSVRITFCFPSTDQ